MSNNIGIIVLFFISIFAANTPFVNEKLFLFIKKRSPKSFSIRLFEWLIMYMVTMAVAMGLEKKLYGELYPQDWEFYVTSQ